MPFLTVKEVAKLLRLSERTVYNLIRLGKLPAARVGGVYRLDQKEVESWAKTSGKKKPLLETKSTDFDQQKLLTKIKEEADNLKKDFCF